MAKTGVNISELIPAIKEKTIYARPRQKSDPADNPGQPATDGNYPA